MQNTIKYPGLVIDADETVLRELFIDGLKDIYWAERTVVNALPEMANAAASDKLRKTIWIHLDETKRHVRRLETVFPIVNHKIVGIRCKPVSELIAEAKGIIARTEATAHQRDAVIVSIIQKALIYEIGAYGTLKTLAMLLSYSEAVHLLDATLVEENRADRLFTQLAVNPN